ncbi:P-loop containing nucleoside triphosphate hydrolase protein [Flammula alnicola]|nr:P-loop containing nucleoside triphosphate hydrolase protein [Flammula alnicola]
MEMLPSTSAAQALKEKSKAKQRYLKRKKERRKHRPKSSAEGKNEEVDVDEDAMDTGAPPTLLEVANTVSSPNSVKRRKKHVDMSAEDEEMIVEEGSPMPTRTSHTPELSAALPSFPLPALPNAPSKSLLALQGLDQALIGAELVSPSTVLSIPSGKDDGGQDIGITELFAVQTALLPFLLPAHEQPNTLYLPFNPPRDVCVSAPTGSGKTLAYVLPIIEVLSSRVVTRLRALIVLPTRDLVAQVRETFEVLSKGTKLKIGTATGQHSFAHEQSQLIQDQTMDLHGGSSKVDILICTPGRLIDHIVIDEADRLLAQSFQDWLAQVLAATRPHPKSSFEHPIANQDHGLRPARWTCTYIPPSLPHHVIPSFFLEQPASSCQKLLFSATLTRDPGKIVALDLRNPKYFVVQGSEKDSSDSNVLDVVMEKFSMPSTLKEHMIVSESTQKPLIFFHLVHAFNVTNALVFTKSAESTTRLVRLFDFFEAERARNLNLTPLVVRSYSSDLPVNERKTILEQFKNQKIHILVCSDLISRGIDISHVSHVVSYDVPVDMRKYVHRVGRTARAGRDGDAWTLVEEQEARYFKQMLKEADHLDKVKRMRVGEKDLVPLTSHYEVALGKLKEVYTRQG